MYGEIINLLPFIILLHKESITLTGTDLLYANEENTLIGSLLFTLCACKQSCVLPLREFRVLNTFKYCEQVNGIIIIK